MKTRRAERTERGMGALRARFLSSPYTPLGSQRLSRSSGAFCVTQRFSKVRDDPNRLQSIPSGPRVSVLNSESQSNGSILFLLGISCCPYYRGERKATVDCTRCSTHHPLTLHTTKTRPPFQHPNVRKKSSTPL